MSIILWILGVLLGAIVLIAIYDIFIQRTHSILHNYPVIGHMRYILEMIGPELRQYWVAHDKEEMPFDRTERSWIYTTAKGANNYFGFGSTELHY
ncbi:MAG: FMN-binding glutamate synthase family protein, partial [Granulosicoccaceae bacterium]